MLDGLNEFSQRFARALFEVYPEWRPYARVDDGLGDTGGSLIVEVPAPNPNHCRLFVYTDNDEVTIGFDYFHDHFGWPDVEEQVGFARALEFIRTIIGKEVSIAVTRRGDEWRGSTVIELDERPIPDEGERITVRSWRGTYDAEYHSESTPADWFGDNA